MNMFVTILLASSGDSISETFARGAWKGVGGLIVVGFLLLVVWIIKKISGLFGRKSDAESIRSIQEQIREEKRTTDAKIAREKTIFDIEQHQKAKREEAEAEKAKKEAEEAQKKADASILAAMEELETGNLDKLTWGKALIAADGDEKRAKIEYLKIRRID